MLRSPFLLFAKYLIVTLAVLNGSLSFQPSTILTKRCWNTALPTPLTLTQTPTTTISILKVFKTEDETKTDFTTTKKSEQTTEKYGLEAGLFQSLKSNDGESAKSLLAKYGVAYLATSIPLALVSFLTCFALVDNGVNVGSLLSNFGIDASDTGEKAGTFAIAYAAHKAASPIRFPPTVLLTPMVAKFIGREPTDVAEGERDE